MSRNASLSRRRFTALLAKLAGGLSAISLPVRAAVAESGAASLKRQVTGDVIGKNDPDYDAWRSRMTPWQLRKTERRPDLIVQARSVSDVAAVVRFAEKSGARIAVRSGGHSWVSSSVRDEGVLLDVGSFRDLSIDAEARTAVVGPAIRARELATALERAGLAFPVAHCSNVALGGYLLGGGQGWNWGSWGGPACRSIEALDVVNARGEVIRVDASNHGDLYWAARGAGPGFPGVVVNYHLKLYPLPKAIYTSSCTWPLSATLAVADWLPRLSAALSHKVEVIMFLMTLPETMGAQKAVSVSAVAFADTPAEARELLAPMSEAVSLAKPMMSEELQPATFNSLLTLVDPMYPPCRAAADTFWFDLSMEAVMARFVDLFAAAPSPLSNAICEVMPEPLDLPDMAYSMRRPTFVAPYSFWMNEKDDEANLAWMKKTQELLAPLAAGHYINEADLEAGPERSRRSYTEENWRKLMAVRRKYDPNGLFHDYLGLHTGSRADAT